jgi:hypothetical protein
MGGSDTTRNWDAQLASDQLLTMAFERIMQHQQYYMMPQRGVYDFAGNRFEFRDDQFNVMYADLSDPTEAAPRVEVVQGNALDSAWPMYWQAVQTTLLSHQGIADLGLTPESSKAIAGTTVAQLNQMGEIPVDHFKRRMNRALGQAAGVHWDYIRATYTPARLARLNLDDENIVVRLRGDELPNFDFVVEVSPPFTGIEKERAEAFQALFGLAQQVLAGQAPPEIIGIFAEVNNLPPSIVRKVDRMVKNAMTPELPPGIPPEIAAAMGGAQGAQANPFLPQEAGADVFDEADFALEDELEPAA